MKYNLSINQLAYINLGLIDSLDAIDMLIYDALRKFSSSPKIDKMQSNGFIWYKFRWTIIPKQLPIIKIKTRVGIMKRLKKLKDAGIIIAHEDNQKNNDAWYRFSEKSDLLEFQDESKQSYTGGNNHIHTNVNNHIHATVNSDILDSVNDDIHDNDINIDNTIKEDNKIKDNISKERELNLCSWLRQFYQEEDFSELLNFQTQPSEKFIRGKIQELGEDSVKKVFRKIEKYCKENSGYSKDRKVLASVFNKFSESLKTDLEERAEEIVSKYYREYLKIDEDYHFTNACSRHLKDLLSKISSGVAKYNKIEVEALTDNQIIEALDQFFSNLPDNFQKAKEFKLTFINHNYQSIKNEIRQAINSSKESGSKNSTFKGVGNVNEYGI